eukprot:scpid92783/ scgid21025/ 
MRYHPQISRRICFAFTQKRHEAETDNKRVFFFIFCHNVYILDSRDFCQLMREPYKVQNTRPVTAAVQIYTQHRRQSTVLHTSKERSLLNSASSTDTSEYWAYIYVYTHCKLHQSEERCP